MTNTYNFALPLLQAAQAQKHVTMNEALARMDATAQMRLVDIDVTSPPVASDGAAFGIGVSATGDWAGHDGEVAIFANGGWVFVTPKLGWKAWNETTETAVLHDGTIWQDSALAVTGGGAATLYKIKEIVHTIGAGASSTTINMIPINGMVYGVTGRVETAISGSGIASWSLGIPGSPTRYGYGLGLVKNSYAHGVTGTPIAYYGDTPLIITPNAGSLTGGVVRLAVHYFALEHPRAV